MKRNLQGMAVVITGATAGIGRDLAIRLAERGANLVLGARRIDRLTELAQSLGPQHLAVQCDVAREADCQSLMESAIARFGRIDTLVCNAGYAMPETVALTSNRDMEAVFRTNVFGTTDCIHYAVPHMVKQPMRDGWRGQVMIVSSAAARRGLPYFGAYAATKAAQLSLAEALRVELSPVRVAVTSVHPISTDTDFFKSAYAASPVELETRKRRSMRQPVGTVGKAMVRGIERPRPEVWTSLSTRMALAVTTLVPSIGDWVMNRMCREIEQLNRKPQA